MLVQIRTSMLLVFVIPFLVIFPFCIGGFTPVARLENGLLTQILKQSYGQCVKKCNSNIQCVSVKYFRHYLHCKLFETDIQQLTPSREFVVYTKPVELQTEHQTTLTHCNSAVTSPVVAGSCQRQSCPDLMIHGATSFGNNREIGAVVKCKCNDTTESEQSTCQSDGTWTPVYLACCCKETAPFEFDIIDLTPTHIRVQQVCPSGTIPIPSVSPSCELATGNWLDTCCESTEATWVQVFNISQGFDSAVGAYWNGPYTTTIEEDLIMRSVIIDNWETLNITQVKVNINKNGVTVASVLFNACHSDKITWFEQRRLISSPWTDLHRDSPVQEISIAVLQRIRFTILQTVSDVDICTSTGWMAVSKKCKVMSAAGVEIQYAATTGNAVSFNDMERADEMVIWLRFAD